MNLGLLIKSVGPVGLGGGIGVGGVALYKNTSPESWRELLEREGVYLINSESDYKAIFYDQTKRIKETEDLKDGSTVDNAYSKIKKWCEEELKKKPSSETDLSDQKEKIIDLCSHKGITSVKGRVAQAGKTNWIEDLTESKESKYKTIFAIYKYYPPFLEWLNEGKGDSERITESDKAETKYSDLQTKCQTIVKNTYPESFDNKVYNYSYWWCQPLSYSKVQERIQALDTSWKKPEKWESVHEKWKETIRVTNVIKGDDKDAPDKDKFKTFCEEQLKKELSEEGVYRDKYLVVKAVCREEQGE